jgi:hypothetical protein
VELERGVTSLMDGAAGLIVNVTSSASEAAAIVPPRSPAGYRATQASVPAGAKVAWSQAARPVRGLNSPGATVLTSLPKICITAHRVDADLARAQFARSLGPDPRAFDVMLESNIATSHHAATVTVEARVVVSDVTGVTAMASASATARGKARAAALPVLRDQATLEAMESLARCIRPN